MVGLHGVPTYSVSYQNKIFFIYRIYSSYLGPLKILPVLIELTFMCYFNMNAENPFRKYSDSDPISLSIKPLRLVCTSRVLFLFLFLLILFFLIQIFSEGLFQPHWFYFLVLYILICSIT